MEIIADNKQFNQMQDIPEVVFICGKNLCLKKFVKTIFFPTFAIPISRGEVLLI